MIPVLSTHSLGKKSKAVIFDIGSGSVGAALVTLNRGEKPEIEYSLRLPFASHEELDFKLFERSMRVTLLDAALTLQSKGIAKASSGKVDYVFCVFSSPWYLSKTKILTLKQQKSFVVTEQGLDEMLNRAVISFRKKQKDIRVAEGSELVDKNIIATKLNGYPSVRPQGRRVRELELALYLSVMGINVLAHVREVMEKVFHQDTPRMTTLSLALFSVLRELFPHDEQFLMIEIGREVTDIGVVRGGILLETASFPKGSNTIARVAAKKLKTSLVDAEARIRTASREDASTPEQAVLETARDTWQKSLEDSLTMLSDEGPLPQTVFLSAPRHLGSWYQVAAEKAAQPLFAGEGFRVAVLDRGYLAAQVALKQKGEMDPYLALESIFFNKMVA